jgi:hypothetical protein
MKSRHRYGVRNRGSAIAEFGPVLWMFLILFVVPLLDLVSFACAVGTIMYVANFGARTAGGAETFSAAKTQVMSMETRMLPFIKFAKSTPTSGGPSGITVLVVVTPTGGGSGPAPFTTPGSIPNSTPDPAFPNAQSQYNTENSVYQYLVTCSYNVMPMFNGSGIPIIKNIPVIGKPVPVTYTATAPVEHVEGLNN